MRALFLCLAMVSCSSWAITPFKANYTFAYNQQQMGTATRTLTQKDQIWTYDFQAHAEPLASAQEISTFSFNNGQIQSHIFKRNVQILFKSEKFATDITQENVLDELNAEQQVIEDIKHQCLKPEYNIITKKGIVARQFSEQGTEIITTPYGQLETLKVQMAHDNTERNTIFWLAPKLDYLPVKIVHNDDGTSYSLILTQYQQF